MRIREFQKLIEETYYKRDAGRGLGLTFMWFIEEIGELAKGLVRPHKAEVEEEFADVLAWLATLASIHGVDLEDVARAKYGAGCPRCGGKPCHCPMEPPAASNSS